MYCSKSGLIDGEGLNILQESFRNMKGIETIDLEQRLVRYKDFESKDMFNSRRNKNFEVLSWVNDFHSLTADHPFFSECVLSEIESGGIVSPIHQLYESSHFNLLFEYSPFGDRNISLRYSRALSSEECSHNYSILSAMAVLGGLDHVSHYTKSLFPDGFLAVRKKITDDRTATLAAMRELVEETPRFIMLVNAYEQYVAQQKEQAENMVRSWLNPQPYR